jgi:copper(I)-binding protein
MIARRLHPPRSLRIGSMLVGIAFCTASAVAEPSVTAESAWVAWAPPTLKVHAAYLTLNNESASDKQVLGADSPDYERIELHRSVVKDSVSAMQPVESIIVPANGRVEFAPGGLHLMLVGPKRPQVPDGRVKIVLHLSGAEEIEVSAVVRRREDAGHSAHSHH